MTSKRQFQQLAEMHAEDARMLLGAHRHTNAVHLAGVALECSLKALICDHFLDGVLPDRKIVDRAHSHQLDDLMGLSGIKGPLQVRLGQDADFEVRWSLVRAWSISTRYETISRPEATEFVSAAVGEEGMLAWIKTFW